MKALSLKQPWANAIAKGFKTIETRTWETSFRGDLLICSSLKPDFSLKIFPKKNHPQKGIWCKDVSGGFWNFNLDGYYQFGKAICIVELFHIEKMKREHKKEALCDVYDRAFAWHLRNIRPITPFDVKGMLRLFNVEYKED